MKFSRNKKVKEESGGPTIVMTDADFTCGENRMTWGEVAEYRVRKVGPAYVDVVSRNGKSVRVPRSVRVYYGQFPVAVGPDPIPFIVQRMKEMNPDVREVAVSEFEMLTLLIVLNTELIGVIFAMMTRRSVGVAMVAAAVVGGIAGIGVSQVRKMPNIRVPWRK